MHDNEGSAEVNRCEEGSGNGAKWEKEEMTELNYLVDVHSYCCS